MSRETFQVKFQPDGRNVFVLRGTKLIEAAGQAGIILNTPCGGEGTCGKCRVEVLQDAPEPTEADRRHLAPEQLRRGLRLACQLVVDRDMVVSVPQETRFFEQVVLTEGREHRFGLRPGVSKRYVELPPPGVSDVRSDMSRLKEALAPDAEGLRADLWLVRSLPSFLRRQGFRGTVVLRNGELLCLEEGDTSGELWGVAFDVGTTTVVGALVNLSTGERAGVASRTNPQVHFGDDVVSRIRHCEVHPDGLEQLNQRIVNCLNDIILELTAGAGVDPRNVYEATAVGNTTMMHILLGIDPSPIAHAPYVASFKEALDVKAREVGLEINPNGYLHVLPNIAGFVGSDTVGVVLASGMNRADEVRLAVDIGTNGEIVVGNRDRLVACSCAAGPAFEGARIRYGMRAAEGAISKVVINERIEANVIGGGRARGLCGSGLLDAVAELLRVGIIEPSGRIVAPEALPREMPRALRDAVVTCDGQPAVVLVDGHASQLGEPVLLTQRDVRELQLAKAAVWAGIQVAASELGLEPGEVSQVLLAGAFGNFIRRSNAKRIGLLPDVPTSRIEFIGNAAFVGARLALGSLELRRECEAISARTEYVELANRPDFQRYFAEAMMFPTDAGGARAP